MSDTVPRGHCNRCDRCGWTLSDPAYGGCAPGDCSMRTGPDYKTVPPRDTCAGCGKRYEDAPVMAPDESRRNETSGRSTLGEVEQSSGSAPTPESAGERAIGHDPLADRVPGESADHTPEHTVRLLDQTPQHDDNCWSDGTAWHCTDACSVAKWRPMPPQPDAITLRAVAAAARTAAEHIGWPAAAGLLRLAEALEMQTWNQ